MIVKITFSDGTEVEKEFSEAQEHALFVDILKPQEWIFNVIEEKSRRVIDEEITKAGVGSRYTETSLKETLFVNLNLPRLVDTLESGTIVESANV